MYGEFSGNAKKFLRMVTNFLTLWSAEIQHDVIEEHRHLRHHLLKIILSKQPNSTT